jgi:CubicO group peptidase (beta-lactamase class C family)
MTEPLASPEATIVTGLPTEQSSPPERSSSALRKGPQPDRWTGEIALPAADPVEVGMDRRTLERALALVRRRRAAAQLCVIRSGRVAVHHAFGCEPDALFWIFSVSKPYTAVLTHLLADRGLFSLDDPVARHWPEFGRFGKEQITIRQVLQHRTGFATTGSPVRDMLSATDWFRAVRLIEETRPRRPAGSAPSYQFLIFGFILGELIERTTGRPIRDVMRAELIDPLGLTDTHLGIGTEEWPRHVPVVFGPRAGGMTARAFNQISTRQAVIPSAGISATAYDVARFYRMLLSGRTEDGRELISPQTIARARTPSSNGEIDRLVRMPIPWSQGFQLGGDRGPGRVPPFGYLSSRRTFGHNGSNCCIAWADPDRDLAFAYLSNLRVGTAIDMAHLAAVADQVFASVHD